MQKEIKKVIILSYPKGRDNSVDIEVHAAPVIESGVPSPIYIMYIKIKSIVAIARSILARIHDKINLKRVSPIDKGHKRI